MVEENKMSDREQLDQLEKVPRYNFSVPMGAVYHPTGVLVKSSDYDKLLASNKRKDEQIREARELLYSYAKSAQGFGLGVNPKVRAWLIQNVPDTEETI